MVGCNEIPRILGHAQASMLPWPERLAQMRRAPGGAGLVPQLLPQKPQSLGAAVQTRV